MTNGPVDALRFEGSQWLAQRLVISTLLGRALRVTKIRASSPTEPGIAAHELSLLRLLEEITNGSTIELSYTGTAVLYRPGLLAGGVVRHELPATCTRGASYFLLPLCLLAPFAKAAVNVTLAGPGVITSCTAAGDVSADTVRSLILPAYAHCGISRNVELRILRRSLPGPKGAGGAGEVQLVFGHQLRLPRTLHLLAPGRIKRVRGVAYAVGVPADHNARMITAARAVLNNLAPDVYIYSDVSGPPAVAAARENRAFELPKRFGVGFGLALVAESSTGVTLSADVASDPSGGQTADEIGRLCAYQLLEAISVGGCVSAVAAPTVFMLMAMGSEDVGRIMVSKELLVSANMVTLARDLEAFGARGWGFRDVDQGPQQYLVASVVGKGVGNVSKKLS